jgi:tripartite-type tricarboxylate transporter receptor subunit TctC
MSLPVVRRSFIRATGLAVAILVAGTCAWAQTWPSKPIRIVVAYPAGGLVDLYARAYGEYLSEKLGQPVIVENKPGAAGSLGALAVKASPADGYTLLFALTGTLVQNRVLYKNLGYDADKDFVLISSMFAGHLPFVAAKTTGATNLKEFVDYARKNKVSVGTWGPGSGAHIAVAELNKQFGLQMEPVHYRGEIPMWQDLSAGVLQGAMGSYANASNVLQSGAGKAIAVQLTTRAKKLPEVATFIEQGATSKYFNLKGYICLVGPAGISREMVERLSALMVEAGKTARVQKLLDTFGIDEAAQGHAEFKKLHEEEKPHWLELVSGLGLTPE